jgi:hypothetical protein
MVVGANWSGSGREGSEPRGNRPHHSRERAGPDKRRLRRPRRQDDGRTRLSEDEVLETLRHPDQTNLRADPGRLRYRKHFVAGRVDVVFELDVTQVVVVSVWRR